jgi:quaternary ammonium compound-resistance protein SugE
LDWTILILAGLCEVFWATGLKLSAGFTRLGPSAAAIFGAALSFILLAKAIKTLPLGTAYAIWTGIGAVGSVIVGICIFKEPCTAARIFFITLIVAGIVGLKLTSV